jgi:hypothetical protein
MKLRIFIGCSVEGKPLAEAIQANLDHDFYCTIWPQSVFVPGTNTIDSLLDAVRMNDFGIFVLSPDDDLTLRGAKYLAARDNVILEAGMFLGRYGKHKAFLVTPRGIPVFHIPSDLLGITLADYDHVRLKSDTPQATLGSACTKVKNAIMLLPNHANDLVFQVGHLLGPGSGPGSWTVPSKLSIDITNKSKCSVVLKPICFRYGSSLKRAPNANAIGNPADNRFSFKFRGPTIHSLESALLVPGDSTNTFVGIDPAMIGTDVQKAINGGQLGELQLNCYWLDDHPRVQYHVVTL